MDRFDKKINMDPGAVRGMSLDQKKECMAEIESRRDLAWKFSGIFFLGSLIYMVLYMLLSLAYMLRFERMPQNLSFVYYAVPLFVAVPSFCAHSMNGRCIVWAVLAYMFAAFGVILTGSINNAWIAPFAIAGSVIYIRLSNVCDIYQALSKEKGFPEFEDLEELRDHAKFILAQREKKEDDEAPLNALTETAVMTAKREEEKKAAVEAESACAEEEKAPSEEETTPDENIPAEEEKPAKDDIKPEAPEEKTAEAPAKENINAGQRTVRKRRWKK